MAKRSVRYASDQQIACMNLAMRCLEHFKNEDLLSTAIHYAGNGKNLSPAMKQFFNSFSIFICQAMLAKPETFTADEMAILLASIRMPNELEDDAKVFPSICPLLDLLKKRRHEIGCLELALLLSAPIRHAQKGERDFFNEILAELQERLDLDRGEFIRLVQLAVERRACTSPGSV